MVDMRVRAAFLWGGSGFECNSGLNALDGQATKLAVDENTTYAAKNWAGVVSTCLVLSVDCASANKTQTPSDDAYSGPLSIFDVLRACMGNAVIRHCGSGQSRLAPRIR